jgi:hypothetical protein
MNSLAAAAKYLVAQFVVIGCCGGDERRGIDHCYCVLFASSVSLKWSSCLYLWGCCAVRDGDGLRTICIDSSVVFMSAREDTGLNLALFT